MTAHDSSHPAEGTPLDLDEDLFDFPVLELGPEGLRDPTVVAAPMATDAAHAAHAPAAPFPSNGGATSSATTLGTAHPTIMPVTQAPGHTGAAPHKNTAIPKEAPAVAAQPIAEMPGGRWRVLVAALAALFVLNGAAFFYLYRTHAAFGAGIEDLRSELGDATVRLERARNEIKEHGAGGSNTGPYTVGETIDSLERQAVAMAESEIQTRDFASARRRLYRVLAQADRLPASLRAELEPRASYLIARSYYAEAQSRAEASR